ncbi:MAG: polyprenyl synthetase family protein [Chlamydiae bacterium CG10_big_fil_rev_8_21_14_0_10_35_9]|nr:MAG: polyprenyl synthetase family protein [Chlamydiae bacterium CG10_big_fil_rev_8_21_14_0_10_35_9]
MRKKFYSYMKKIDSAVNTAISNMGSDSKLRQACEYALNSGGKRFRPLLVLSVAEALGNGYNVLDSALCIEFFHTASLIADDLPCMDDETKRRSKPTVHLVYGESVALLASYTLIAAAYEKIHTNAEQLKEVIGEAKAYKISAKALQLVSNLAGLNGATHGQFIDLYPPDNSLETLRKVIYQKTVTLFEISFYLGWLFGGGDTEKLPLVKACAYHLGMAFQIADDLNDLDHPTDKSNFAKLLGIDLSLQELNEHLFQYEAHLKELGLDSPEMLFFAKALQKGAKV